MPINDSRVAVYTGSFDPITLGHINVIERASRLVDKLIVGIGINIEKQSLFTPDERVELMCRATQHLPNVEVKQFSGLAVHFVRAVRRARHAPRRAIADRYRERNSP